MKIGIDLGTTFSAVAYVDSEGKARIIENELGDKLTPSTVMFSNGEIKVGEYAKNHSVEKPLEVVQFVKRFIGQKSACYYDVSNEQSYTAEEISAIILHKLKEDAERGLNEKVEGAVITVPAYFDDTRRMATKNAGKIAGLDILGIINEPTAAAIAYCYNDAKEDENVMVFDLGGGAFDITILKLVDNLSKIEILASTGNPRFGGYDFDSDIIKKVYQVFLEKTGIDLDDDDKASQKLKIDAEKAKMRLSCDDSAIITVVSGGKSLDVEITKEEFENLIHKHMSTFKANMEIAVEEAGLKWKDLSKILLVGGSTKIPAIRNMIEDTTGIAPSTELNPDEVIALGAAYYTEILAVRKMGIQESISIDNRSYKERKHSFIKDGENDFNNNRTEKSNVIDNNDIEKEDKIKDASFIQEAIDENVFTETVDFETFHNNNNQNIKGVKTLNAQEKNVKNLKKNNKDINREILSNNVGPIAMVIIMMGFLAYIVYANNSFPDTVFKFQDAIKITTILLCCLSIMVIAEPYFKNISRNYNTKKRKTSGIVRCIVDSIVSLFMVYLSVSIYMSSSGDMRVNWFLTVFKIWGTKFKETIEFMFSFIILLPFIGIPILVAFIIAPLIAAYYGFKALAYIWEEK